MSESAKAIFLSYASQDADVARRICEALRDEEYLRLKVLTCMLPKL